MGLARSTYYDEPELQPIGEARLVEQIKAICAEWSAYGYRRVTAELHERPHVNHKKVMRLMKENGLNVRPRRRFIATTDTDHDGRFPEPCQGHCADEPKPTVDRRHHLHRHRDQFRLSRGDPGRLVTASVGYAIGKRIDARLALAALRAAIAARRPSPGCIHHSDRGSQYAAEDYRAELDKHDLKGSMRRRGNPYDNAKAESFMKTLKVEEVYLIEYETFDDVAASCRVSSKKSIMPSVAARRSDSKVLSVRTGTRPADRH